MPTDVVMPQMGESIFEGTITKWLKKAGDAVEKDEPLFEISTDKVDAEIPSPISGVLSEIKVLEGATVQINTVVAVVSESGETGEAIAQPAQAKEAQVLSTPPQGSDVVMPQMGESIFEGTITKWLKQAGDTVGKDEPLFEISTDKVDAEIPSPVAGILSEIKVPEGATVQINTVVAVVSQSGGTSRPISPAPSASAIPLPPQVVPQAQSAPPQSAPKTESAPAQVVRSSPLVRRIARENNLDLRQIAGTGCEGRITKEDALRFLSEHGPGSNVTAPPPPVPALAPAPASLPPAPAASQLAGQLVPMTRMRAIIAQRMIESTQTSPHAYTVYKVDMTRIVHMREREKAGFEQRNGVKLTYMPFIAAAVAQTLRKFPIVNASLEGSSIRYHQKVNLGIAVALEWGLIVPVIQGAEERNFLGLARSIADLALRARTKKLKPEEVTGSTFTLTNSGVFGGEFGTPILNQPESAILAIGGLKKEAVVLTDQEGNDTLAIRSTQHFCLGFDHRIIDGGDAGKFMLALQKALEGWDKEIG
jgi:2-oxoglutarate dehydrogenase E2 component (dihydrolipoamide succinyltransferase)